MGGQGTAPQPAAGWYPDPTGPGGTLRYWDGRMWTSHVSAAGTPAPIGTGWAPVGGESPPAAARPHWQQTTWGGAPGAFPQPAVVPGPRPRYGEVSNKGFGAGLAKAMLWTAVWCGVVFLAREVFPHRGLSHAPDWWMLGFVLFGGWFSLALIPRLLTASRRYVSPAKGVAAVVLVGIAVGVAWWVFVTNERRFGFQRVEPSPVWGAFILAVYFDAATRRRRPKPMPSAIVPLLGSAALAAAMVGIFIFARGSALVPTSTASVSEWVPYAAPDGSFTVDASSTRWVTRHQTPTVAGPIDETIHQFGSDSEPFFAIDEIVFPSPVTNPNAATSDLISGERDNGIRVTAQRLDRFGNDPADDLSGTASVDGLTVTMKGELVMGEGTTWYLIISEENAGSATASADLAKFMAGFHPTR